MTATVRDWLADQVVNMLSIDLIKVTDAARFEQELGGDSLDVLDLIMSAEDHYQISIAGHEIDGITTFGQAVALVMEKLEAKVATRSPEREDAHG